jgi:hypothetical protein
MPAQIRRMRRKDLATAGTDRDIRREAAREQELARQRVGFRSRRSANPTDDGGRWSRDCRVARLRDLNPRRASLDLLVFLLLQGAFGFRVPLFHCSLSAELYAAFVVDPDAFHPDQVADFHDVLDCLNPKICELGNMH